MANFRDKLEAAQARSDSWLCVGLDPDPAQMPPGTGVAEFCQRIVEATHDVACAFKPNLAFFLAHGSQGIADLEQVIHSIPPDVPVLLDCKVGDISNTQRMYGEAAFGSLGVDAITVSPYVGEDAVVPLLKAFPGCGLYILCRSSNPDAARFQDFTGGSLRLFEQVAHSARNWARAYPESTVGLVVGSTFAGEMRSVRQLAPDLPFLIPGIGAQSGELEAAVRYGAAASGPGPLISVGRAILYAGRGADYAAAARRMAVTYRDDMNVLRMS